MAELEEEVEHTLHIVKSVSAYRIPPRPGANGWRSGEWLVSDKLFNGRMRIVAKGDACEIRLEEPNSGELFATCPIQYGHRNVCVEPVTDSSRYYVLRVEDPATHRHAFLGMGFDSRGDAFDFNEALVRHEQHVARDRATRAKACDKPSSASFGNGPVSGSFGQQYCSMGPAAAAADNKATAEVEGLYRPTSGLRLQEGQTIRVNLSGLKKPGAASASATGGGFLSGAAAASRAPAGSLSQPTQSIPWQNAATQVPMDLKPSLITAKPASPSHHGLPSNSIVFTHLQATVPVSQTNKTVNQGVPQMIGFSATACGQDNWATFD